MVWVQALEICEYNGETNYPGDWFETSRANAKRWMSEKRVDIRDPKKKAVVQELFDCGVSLKGEDFAPTMNVLVQQFPGLEISLGNELTHPRCLLWDIRADLRTELIPVGMDLLKTWHVAIPLLDYDTLARDITGGKDRDLTLEQVHDLRIPVYDTRVIFARRCRDTNALFGAWDEERERGSDERAAFLRALHRTIPLINALPPTWVR